MDNVATKGLESVVNLAVYGPLGVLSLLAIGVAIILYLHGRKDRKHYETLLSDERKASDVRVKEMAEQMRVLEERYIAKAETNTEKYQALAEAMNRVLDTATRRYSFSGGPQHGRGEDPNG